MADKRSGDDLESPAKRLVTKSTVEKWIRDSDKELNTTIWLGYEMKDRDHVACLKWTVCSMFRERLVGMQNFSNAFIEGSVNLRSVTIRSFKKCNARESKPTCSTIQNTPIVRALQTLDQKTCDQMMKKFDIAYFMAKENLALNKFDAIVNWKKSTCRLGQMYNNRCIHRIR